MTETLSHLPECRSVPVNDLRVERGEEPDERFESIHIQKCADGCPRLAQTLERAQTVAREQGWLTDEGFIWEGES